MTENNTKRKGSSNFINSIGAAFSLLRKNDPLRLAGATAFFTTFALPVIVFLVAQLFGLIIGRRDVSRGLIEHISNTLGEEGAEQVLEVIRSIIGFSDEWYVTVFGFLFLVFIATTLFAVIKNSLDQIWQISVKEKAGLVFYLSARLRSFAIIMFVGILFIADLVVQSLQLVGIKSVEAVWKDGAMYFETVTTEIASAVVIAAWFIVLFRFLADGRPTWRASIAGGIVTGVLFIAGRMLLRFLLVESNIGSLYGASGSFVLVLLFVFYSSFILYYGACFIAVYSEKTGSPITPTSKAYNFRIEKLDEEGEVIPDNEQ